MSKEFLFFISTLGWFNGLLLGSYFLFFYKNRKLSGIMFGLMLMALSIRIAKSVLWWFNPELPVIIVQIGLVACLFIGPFVYYFVQSSRAGIKEMPQKWKVSLAGYVLIALILLLFFSSEKFIPAWRNYIIPAIYIQWSAYVFVSGIPLKKIFVMLFNKYQLLKPNERWVLGVYTSSLLIVIAYVLSYFNSSLSYITGPVGFSLLLYLNLLILLYRKKTNDLFQSEPEKYANKKIDNQKAAAKLKELEQLMKEQQVFTNPNLKLNDLAALLEISGHQLSQLLNDNVGKSFNMYINDCRIEKACEIIANNSELKLEAVSYDVGFNSKSTFFATFKRNKGITPKQYKEQLG